MAFLFLLGQKRIAPEKKERENIHECTKPRRGREESVGNQSTIQKGRKLKRKSITLS